MILPTGGSAFGETSTKSMLRSRAMRIASRVSMMPNCSPSSVVTRTCGTRIRSLILVTGARRKSGRPRPRKPVAMEAPPGLSLKSGVKQSGACKLQTSDSRLRTVVVKRSRHYQTRRHLLKLIHRHRTDVALRPLAHGNLAFFHLAIAEHEHERNLLQLGIAYLRANLVVA